MKTVEIVRQVASLKAILRSTGHHSSTKSLEMMSHWAKYACVIEAGLVENIVRNIYGVVATKQSSPRVANYAKSQLEGVQNPKTDRLVKIASSFDKKWGKDLESFLAQNFRQDAVNAVMSNRHPIAHGRNCNITVSQVSFYLTKIEEIAGFLEKQCDI